jgi:hypothetical protein
VMVLSVGNPLVGRVRLAIPVAQQQDRASGRQSFADLLPVVRIPGLVRPLGIAGGTELAGAMGDAASRTTPPYARSGTSKPRTARPSSSPTRLPVMSSRSGPGQLGSRCTARR